MEESREGGEGMWWRNRLLLLLAAAACAVGGWDKEMARGRQAIR